MTAKGCGTLFLAAVLLLAGAAARADDSAPILGKWVISGYRLAPWSRPEDAPQLNADAKKLFKLQVTYSAKAIAAKNSTIACKNAHYEKSDFPYSDLFQGALGELSAEARAKTVKDLGLPPEPIPGIELGCSTGEFSYHFRDPNTVLFALSDVIYILTRQ
ncbi:MAG TPA: hypothetical protein VN823_00630 [Stellaceae bacterium]|nr:hypothetical protein [Stellaceae bacterium]